MPDAKKSWLSPIVFVGALGYFVDIYDLILFSVVRVPSLKDLGVPDAQILDSGISILNWQMSGMLLGGILWGLLGDRLGRIKVLFGSILLYSLANLGCGLVQNVELYQFLRFFAGLGLAGELGAAITLVSESLSKEDRGKGTTFVATIGVSGAIAANLISNFFNWRAAYFVGAGLGLLLLLLRMRSFESGLFEKSRSSATRRGDLSLLFGSPERVLRYLRCILMGLPTWFVVGILITLAPELSKAHGVEGVTSGNAVMYCYSGLVFGDFASGLLSQIIHSRKKVILLFLVLCALFTISYLSLGSSVAMVYSLAFLSGFGVGYWAMFVTVAAEQFGTNLRATVTITVPNWARGALVPISLLFLRLKGNFGPIEAALLVGLLCVGLALISAATIKESFGKDLDFLES
jgi:putative MFS transporter